MAVGTDAKGTGYRCHALQAGPGPGRTSLQLCLSPTEWLMKGE